MYHDNRVSVEPAPARRGQNVDIVYKGLLANSGADACWLHYGFDGWKSPATMPMWRQPDGTFKATVTATGNHELNFCFKDSADHWDNNSGWNWKVDIM